MPFCMNSPAVRFCLYLVKDIAPAACSNLIFGGAFSCCCWQRHHLHMAVVRERLSHRYNETQVISVLFK